MLGGCACWVVVVVVVGAGFMASAAFCFASASSLARRSLSSRALNSCSCLSRSSCSCCCRSSCRLCCSLWRSSASLVLFSCSRCLSRSSSRALRSRSSRSARRRDSSSLTLSSSFLRLRSPSISISTLSRALSALCRTASCSARLWASASQWSFSCSSAWTSSARLNACESEMKTRLNSSSSCRVGLEVSPRGEGDGRWTPFGWWEPEWRNRSANEGEERGDDRRYGEDIVGGGGGKVRINELESQVPCGCCVVVAVRLCG